MVRRHRPGARKMHPLSPAVAVLGAGAALFAFAGSSAAAVTSVAGGAFGEQANVTIAELGTVTNGPTPSVTLPATGGTATQSATAASVGPAGLFLTSGALTVSTQGTTGATGSAASGASITNPNLFQTVEASLVTSTCMANESGRTGATTITNGTIILEGTTVTPLEPSPAPNTRLNGTNADTGDQFTVILNEQTTTNGVLTVNAINFVLRGPTATGFVIIGQSRCGVTGTGTASTTTTGATTPTTRGTATTQGTPTVAGTDTTLARTGAEAPLLPTLALVAAAVGVSRWTRRARPEAPRSR